MKKIISLSMKFVCFFVVSFLLIQTVGAQAVSTIKGKVVDVSDLEVIGASVQVKGTTTGTITDIDGAFTLDKVPSNATLIISFIGYKTQEVKVNGKKAFAIQMVEDAQTLDEVVVVGYGTMRKSDLTGAVASVKGKDVIKSMPTSDFTSALQGRLAGVSIVSTSGQPGSGSAIRVRGVNSVKADQGPLVVIDGFVGGGINGMNPSDIASIEVLKDASATAIYGSAGANGVILVTTRNPQTGKVKVNYNGHANFKTPYNLPDRLSPGEFAELANDYCQEYYRDLLGQQDHKDFYTPEEVAAFYRGEGGYDYLANIFRDVAIEQNHELSISGGNEKTKFLFSGNYINNQGIANGSSADLINYRLKVDSEIRPWLKTGLNFWGNFSKSKGVRFTSYRGILIEGLNFANTIPPKNEDGSYNNMTLTGAPQYNPMGNVWEVDSDGYRYTSRLQGYVDVTLLKGLTFRMTHGFILGNSWSANTNGPNSYQTVMSTFGKTSASAGSSNNYAWNNQNILSYVREFNKNHRINATAVFEQSYGHNFSCNSGAEDGLVSTIIGGNNTALGARMTGSSGRSRSASMAVLGRVNYALMDRYMVTASWRYDGSSVLAMVNHWEQFASGALAWNLKQEKFLRDVKFLSQLKLRAGYGESGNQGGGLYLEFTQLNPRRDNMNNLTLSTGRVGTPDLAWERTKQWNFGLDFGAFDNRLTTTVDVYRKMSSGVLLDVDAPRYTAFLSRLQNAADIKNRGIEVTIGADPIVTKNFNWNTTLTLSHNESILYDLPQGKDRLDVNIGDGGSFRNIKGKKLSTLWGYVSEGVWKSWEIADAPDGMKAIAGACKYKDLDGDGKITPEGDRTAIGNGQPTFQWGWTNTLNYKNFDFGLFIIGMHGFDVYNHTCASRIGLTPNPEMLDRWRPDHEDTNIPGFVGDIRYLTPSTQFIEKGDFVKVKSITLGYSLPKVLLHKAGIDNIRIYASIQNPFLFTSYSGMDPEVTLKSPLTSGVDIGYYPNGRNYLIGLNFSF